MESIGVGILKEGMISLTTMRVELRHKICKKKQGRRIQPRVRETKSKGSRPEKAIEADRFFSGN